MRTITLQVPDELADQLAAVQDRLPELLALSLRQPALPAQLYRAILTFLAGAPSAEKITASAPSPEAQQRLQALLDAERAGTLTAIERAELDEGVVSGTRVPAALRRLVEERARHRCEYCLLPAAVAFFPHEVDHVIAQKHGGTTVEANLAFTCWRCNRYRPPVSFSTESYAKRRERRIQRGQLDDRDRPAIPSAHPYAWVRPKGQ